MYFLCTLQPDLEETRRVGYIGEWMTKAEKRDAILKFYKTRQHIPLSIDHTAAKTFGSAIPPKERVGRVLDLFNDRHGDLIAKCVLDKGSGAPNRLNSGTYLRGEKWGVSVRIDWIITYGLDGMGHVDKTLTHVALTLDPFLAKEGTYVHHWHTNERVVDRMIHEQYYREGDGDCFAAPELQQKIHMALTDVGTVRKKMSDDKLAPTSSNAMMVEPNATAAVNTTSTSTTQPQSPPQQQQQSSSNAQQQQQQRRQPSSASSERLADLEAQLKDMVDLMVDGVPLQKMPSKFQLEYFEKVKQIEDKKSEIAKHVNYLVTNGLLSKEDADPYLQGLGSDELSGKRTIYGYIEASLEDHTRTMAASAAKFRELEESNKRILAEKDREIESMRKKIRLNDYMAPSSSHQGSTSETNRRYDDHPSAPLQRETISLLQVKGHRGNDEGDVVNREVIHDANLRAMFNYEVGRQTLVPQENAQSFSKLVSFMEKWGGKAY